MIASCARSITLPLRSGDNNWPNCTDRNCTGTAQTALGCVHPSLDHTNRSFRIRARRRRWREGKDRNSESKTLPWLLLGPNRYRKVRRLFQQRRQQHWHAIVSAPCLRLENISAQSAAKALPAASKGDLSWVTFECVGVLCARVSVIPEFVRMVMLLHTGEVRDFSLRELRKWIVTRRLLVRTKEGEVIAPIVINLHIR